MIPKNDFKDRFKQAVTVNFDLSGEETDRFEDECGLFGWLTKKLLALTPPLQEQSILDVGCGTGISTRVIVDYSNKDISVFGVDISESMLEKAKTRCPEAVFHLGDAELLTHIFSESFGGIYYNACIFLIPDVKKSLKEASKIMFNGASIAASYMGALEGEEGEDIIACAKKSFPDLGIKSRKLFSFEELSADFTGLFRNVVTEEVRFRMDRKDAGSFFSIPAQSASLFPGEPVQVRMEKVKYLFQTLQREEYFLNWRLICGQK